MQISNNFSVSSIDSARSASRSAPVANEAVNEPSLTPVDQLDLSSEAQAILDGGQVANDDIRVDLVADIRRQIAAGTYDTDEKLSAALDSMLSQWG